MAMEYFDEKIVPILKKKLPGADLSGRLIGSAPGNVQFKGKNLPKMVLSTSALNKRKRVFNENGSSCGFNHKLTEKKCVVAEHFLCTLLDSV